MGFAVGFVAKKILKYLLIAIGIYLASLLYLQQKGWLTIRGDVDGWFQGLTSLLNERTGSLWATAGVSLPVMGAFAAGAYLGFSRG